MITTEGRARAAMRAIGNTVHDAPPLRLAAARDLPAAPDEVRFGGQRTRRLGRRRPGGADRPGTRGGDRRWRSRVAPIAAAVTVAAVAISLVIIKNVPNGRVPPPSSAHSSAGPTSTHGIIPPGVPEYYVAWMQADTPYLLVGSTATGKLVGGVSEPRGVYLEGIYGAAADDRTFIAMGDRVHGPDAGTAAWYLLRIAPGARTPARLTPLPIPVRQDPAGIAISPDGTKLAVALAGSPATLRVYSIPTGKLLRTWSATVPGELAVEPASVSKGSEFTATKVLRWSSDARQLAFAWNSSAIRVLDATAPDGNLITRSRTLAAIGTTDVTGGSFTCNASQGWQLIADGQGVVCAGSTQTKIPQTSPASSVQSAAECARSQRTFIGFLQETGSTNGLTDYESECSAQVEYPDGAYIGWANADGSTVIGSLLWNGHVRFGVFNSGRFTPLPALPVSVPVPTGILIGTYDW